MATVDWVLLLILERFSGVEFPLASFEWAGVLLCDTGRRCVSNWEVVELVSSAHFQKFTNKL